MVLFLQQIHISSSITKQELIFFLSFVTMNIFNDEPSTPTNAHAEENNDDQAEFTNPFCTPVQEIAESSKTMLMDGKRQFLNVPLKEAGLNVHNQTDLLILDSYIQISRLRKTLNGIKTRSKDQTNIVQDVCYSARIFKQDQTEKHLKRLKGSSIHKRSHSQGKSSGTEGSGLLIKQLFQMPINAVAHILRKSTSGGIQFLGENLVSWMSKKQTVRNVISIGLIMTLYLQVVLKLCGCGTQLQDLWLNYNKIPLRIGMRCLTPAELEGRMPTKIELTLEQSQQGVSNDVLVSIEGVEELKRNVWIKGKTYAVRITMLIADIEDDIMDPVMQCTTRPITWRGCWSHLYFSQ
ncbi:hypothetical protein Tco_0378055, partial [Tanacetum coccineum]